MSKIKSSKLDLVGSILSLGCAVHCVFFPILVSLGSLVVIGDVTHELTETIFLMLTLSIGIWSLTSAYPRHKRLGPAFLIMASLVVILSVRFFSLHSYETILNVSGALLITLAHQLNQHFERKVTSSS